MRAIVQRVLNASCEVADRVTGHIDKGLIVYLGIHKDDMDKDLEYLLNKVLNLRIFEDDSGKMNLSVREQGGGLLIISQFTLYGDVSKGFRPNFMDAMPQVPARIIYDKFVKQCIESDIPTVTGVFGAMMSVKYVNDGPVTIIIDSKGPS
jgi:D-aminoacyl-tRNA deacylase